MTHGWLCQGKAWDEGGNRSGTQEVRPAAGWPLAFLVIHVVGSGHRALDSSWFRQSSLLATWRVTH